MVWPSAGGTRRSALRSAPDLSKLGLPRSESSPRLHAMQARIVSLYRHPVKGFTPERLAGAELIAGQCFPCDRLYAVEDGPSGFDPAAPDHVSKMKFTVLAKIPAVAKALTAYDEATGVF